MSAAMVAMDREEAVRQHAVRRAVDDQLRVGLDQICDGAMQRIGFRIVFYEYVSWLEALRRARHRDPGRDGRHGLALDESAGP